MNSHMREPIPPELLPQIPPKPQDKLASKEEGSQAPEIPALSGSAASTILSRQEIREIYNIPPELIEPPKQTFWRSFFYGTGCAYELTKWLVGIIVIVTMIHFYIGTLFIVDGQSMEPNFHNKQYILVNRWQYNFGTPERGDVVVLKFPGDPENKKYIKRLIGLPGDRINIIDGFVYINGTRLNESYIPSDVLTLPNGNWTMRESDYFLLGDNRNNSSDSRIWGICPKRDLIGKAVFTLYPRDMFGTITPVKY